jgi:hypothetical protein
MSGPNERTLRLRVVCHPMPGERCGPYTAIELGIQRGQAVQPGERRADGAMVFECEARVAPQAATGAPNFLGPWVHGPPKERFLYLVWEGVADGRRKMFRRMKIHLSPIDWDLIDAADQAGGVLEARVSGVGKDGTPACASVRLLGEGWTVVSRGTEQAGESRVIR